MEWGVWVLTFVGTVAFWAVVLLGIRALFPSGVPSAERDTGASRRIGPLPLSGDTEEASPSRTSLTERQP